MPTQTWTEPITWILGQVVGEDDANEQWKGNMLYLFERPRDDANSNTQYTTTSGTAVEISNTLRLSVETQGGDLMISFTGSCSVVEPTSVEAHFDVEVDGVLQGGAGGLAIYRSSAPGTVSFTIYVGGLSNSTHTIKFMWWQKNDGSFADATITLGGVIGWTGSGAVQTKVFAKEI